MATDSQTLRQILDDCLSAAQQLGANIEVELTESVEMESESTTATVHFIAGGSAEGSLNVRLLLDQLEERTVVAAIDLFPAPHARLVIHGAVKKRGYRIVIQLEDAGLPT